MAYIMVTRQKNRTFVTERLNTSTSISAWEVEEGKRKIMNMNSIVYFLVSTLILYSTFVESRTVSSFQDPPFRQQLSLSPSTAPSSSSSSPLVPALFVIGDSSVDCGTNNFLATFARADHLPYGRDFDTHQPTGRFSNGRIPVDYLGE